MFMPRIDSRPTWHDLLTMTHTFIAYIDEAGDDGIGRHYRQPGGQGGSSHWLSVGAVIWRASRDLDAVQWAKEILARLPARQNRRVLHFKELDHAQRVMAVGVIAGKPFRSITVFANKPIIPPGIYTQKNQLYFYMCRYLIERISWFCRDRRPSTPEGDGRVKIVFARRGGMSYPEFCEYLARLKNDPERQARIHWPVVDVEAIQALDQIERFGLQISDLVTSGLNAALEPDFYGNTELRFASALKRNIYSSRNGDALGYGVKLVPSEEKLDGIQHVSEFIELLRKR